MNRRSTTKQPSLSAPLRIAGLYAAVGWLWIFLSDRLVAAILHRRLDNMVLLQTLKGWLYVLVTAGLVYWLVKREVIINYHTNRTLKSTLAELLAVQADLQTSEERYRQIVESQTDFVMRSKADTTITFVNTSLCRALGRSPAQLIGTRWHHYVPPEDLSQLYQKIAALTPANSMFENINADYRADGQLGWTQWVNLGVFDNSGNLVEIQSVGRDITSLKRAEEALHRREQEFRALVENDPDIIMRFDRTLRYLYVNPAIENATGLPPDGFLGKTNQDMGMPAPLVAQWDAVFNRVLATGQQEQLEFELPTPCGIRAYQARCVPETMTDGSVASILVVCRDITEQKHLEQALRQRIEQEQALYRIVQAIRQSLDLDTIFATATVEIAQLVQADRSAVVQYFPEQQCWRHLSEYRASPALPDLLSVVIPDQGNVLATQLKQRQILHIHDPSAVEDDINREFAQILPGSWLLVPLVVDGAVWGSFSMARVTPQSPWNDEQITLVQTIADQLAIAIQQAQAFQQARQELAERQRAEANLRAALAEKEVLFKEIHHRVKNNLQIISGLLQLQADSLQDPQVVAALRESQQRIQAMALIHKKLYAVSDLGRIDVVDYIHSLTSSLIASYQVLPGRVRLSVEVEPISLSLDQAIPCGLVINELVSNAFKYGFPNQRAGEVTVTLRHIDGL
ncbi:MAG: PAS domain S-box protein, partial [Cyanobacteria bacterium]|nr:PAS domain S-box protein [Cyanobacteriota bacterium]MDW8202864.1 PAS domain S-box protein [Cyanobacteriota bacterium SKYGB_h_bin112]